MPGTTWHLFAVGETISSAHFNSCFNWLLTDLCPMVGGSMTTNVYDLGNVSYRWNNIYANKFYINGIAWDSVSTAHFTMGTLKLHTGTAIGGDSNSKNDVNKIAYRTISTPDFRDASCSQMTGTASGTVYATPTTVTTCQIIATGKPILVLGHFYYHNIAKIEALSTTAYSTVNYAIYRNGEIITATSQQQTWIDFESFEYTHHFFTNFIDAAGQSETMTYEMRYQQTYEVGTPSICSYSLIALEIKK